MEEIEFRKSLREDSKLQPLFKKSFNSENIKGFFDINKISILTNISNHPCVPPEYDKEIQYFLGLNNFFSTYFWNILLNNPAAMIRKEPPYNLNFKIKIDFEEKKYQIYIFLDDKIFGLVIGKKFANVVNLIRTLFPIFSKSDFVNEVRFFPISRQ